MRYLILFMLLLWSLHSTMTSESQRLQKKFFLGSKFDISPMFSAVPGINPLIMPPLVLILLKPLCGHSQKFKRGIGELLQIMDKRGDIELKIFECPLDGTCPKIFQTKAYPEVRFYSFRSSPKRFFVRMKSRSALTSLKVAKWVSKRQVLQNAANDIMRFDLSAKTGKQVKTKSDEKTLQSKEKSLLRKMRGVGFYHFSPSDLAEMNFWRTVAVRIVSGQKQMVVFCRDRIKGLNYLIIRKITALYPSLRMVELRHCRKAKRDFSQLTAKIQTFTEQLWVANEQIWGTELIRFLKKTLPQILEMISGQSKFTLRLLDFVNSYSIGFTEKETGSITKFRARFKIKKRSPIFQLNQGLMNRIMSQDESAMILFLSPQSDQNVKQQKSIIRDFKRTSKAIRYDKKKFFTIVGGKLHLFMQLNFDF